MPTGLNCGPENPKAAGNKNKSVTLISVELVTGDEGVGYSVHS